jgi:NAD(P)-dependent dehydrogenase (short-subunit alcohol dehydrogenase family)
MIVQSRKFVCREKENIMNQTESKTVRNQAPWTLDQMPRLDGKTIIVTGANSGLGFEATCVFVRAGAHVVLACRNREKTEKAIGRILAETPQASLEFLELDLASLASVRSFAREASERLTRIDILCNNAGVMTIPYKNYSRTRDGFEMHFGINHLGHFALTGLLFEKIVASAPSRIVTVSSGAHMMGEIHFDDLQSMRNAYGNSKLANLLFTYEMDRRLRACGLDVQAVACHPGFASSNLFYTGPEMAQSSLAWWMKLLVPTAQSAEMGALPEIYAAVGEDIQGGDYTGPSGFMGSRGLPKKVQSNARSHDVEIARRLWAVSEELTGVHFLD